MAIAQKNLAAIAWAVSAMLAVILIYDQFLFRPLGAFADRLPQRRMQPPIRLPAEARRALGSAWIDRVWLVLVLIVVIYSAWLIVRFVSSELSWAEAGRVVVLGLLTTARVAVLMALATLVWVPVGVWIGLRPRIAQLVQPLAQLLAAFPANIVFPFAVVAIVRLHLAPDIWLSPLMVLGTQWYILFNVIAGASAFPNDLKEVAANFRVGGWDWWRKVILPGIFPYYVTGAITASGGSWNASIVAEVASWGDTTLRAHGLGAYIADATSAGDYPRIVLGIAVMSVFVILFNRLLWHPLYAYAARRLRLD